MLGGGPLRFPPPVGGVGTISLGSGDCTGAREPTEEPGALGIVGGVLGVGGGAVFATLPDGLGTFAVADADGADGVDGCSVETAGCTE